MFGLFGPVQCRTCGGREPLSSRPSLLRSVVGLVGLRRYRCTACGNSFWRFRVGADPIPVKKVRKPRQDGGGVSTETPPPG